MNIRIPFEQKKASVQKLVKNLERPDATKIPKIVRIGRHAGKFYHFDPITGEVELFNETTTIKKDFVVNKSSKEFIYVDYDRSEDCLIYGRVIVDTSTPDWNKNLDQRQPKWLSSRIYFWFKNDSEVLYYDTCTKRIDAAFKERQNRNNNPEFARYLKESIRESGRLIPAKYERDLLDFCYDGELPKRIGYRSWDVRSGWGLSQFYKVNSREVPKDLKCFEGLSDSIAPEEVKIKVFYAESWGRPEICSEEWKIDRNASGDLVFREVYRNIYDLCNKYRSVIYSVSKDNPLVEITDDDYEEGFRMIVSQSKVSLYKKEYGRWLRSTDQYLPSLKPSCLSEKNLDMLRADPRMKGIDLSEDIIEQVVSLRRNPAYAKFIESDLNNLALAVKSVYPRNWKVGYKYMFERDASKAKKSSLESMTGLPENMLKALNKFYDGRSSYKLFDDDIKLTTRIIVLTESFDMMTMSEKESCEFVKYVSNAFATDVICRKISLNTPSSMPAGNFMNFAKTWSIPQAIFSRFPNTNTSKTTWPSFNKSDINKDLLTMIGRLYQISSSDESAELASDLIANSFVYHGVRWVRDINKSAGTDKSLYHVSFYNDFMKATSLEECKKVVNEIKDAISL